jgi:uncharacterized protein YutE (UPF0331/DUF86 family)
MDRDLIERKLETLRRHVSRIESKRPITLAELEGDADLQDIVAMNLIQAVQTSVDIGMHIVSEGETKMPETMGEVFDGLAAMGVIPAELARRMKAAVGFRNVAVHAYGEMSWGIVFGICTNHLNDFQDFARQVAEHMLGTDAK